LKITAPPVLALYKVYRGGCSVGFVSLCVCARARVCVCAHAGVCACVCARVRVRVCQPVARSVGSSGKIKLSFIRSSNQMFKMSTIIPQTSKSTFKVF